MSHGRGRHSVQPMRTQPSSPTLRESVDELGQRLARIGAAASMLHSLSAQIRHGIPPEALVKVTEDLERDLLLASTQLEQVHERAVLELSSLRDVPRSP
jgi:hypothetical protein